MASRSALLVAIVAVLAGGAFLLLRSVEKRELDGGHEAATDRHTSASADEPAALTVAPAASPTARANLGGDEASPAASSAAPATTRVQVRVIRARTTAAIVPVPNARIEIIDNGQDDGRPRWNVTAKGESDANGLFSFDAPHSFYATVRVEATVDGRKLFGVAGTILPQSLKGPIDVQLSEKPPYEVRATVIDRDTLAPIVGADVRPASGAQPTTTNALGEFGVLLPADAGSAVCAWIGASGYFPVVWCNERPYRSTSIRRRGGEALAPAAAFEEHWETSPGLPTIVYLHRSARILGTMLDAAGGHVAGAELRTRVRLGVEPVYIARDVTAVTGERGRFEFDALPAGIALLVEVRLRGESVQCDLDPLVLEPGETRELTLRVRGHVELTGRVLDVDDKLVREGTISIDIGGKQDKGSIRSDGTYYLPFAVAGTGWISVAREAEEVSTPNSLRVPIVIPPRVLEWTFDVHLVPQSAIAGVFQDSDGRPVRAGMLSLSTQATAMFERRVEDDRGGFQFEAVPAGEYTLTGRETDGARRTVSATVRAGDRGVVLRLPEQGTLRGRVVRAGGEACKSALIHVHRQSGPAVTIRCASDGTYHFPLALGACWVQAESSGAHSRFESVWIEAGRETALSDHVVVPSAELRFMTARFGSSAHVMVADDTGIWFEFDSAPLSERALAVPAGAVRLAVTCAGATTTRALVLERQTALDVPITCGP